MPQFYPQRGFSYCSKVSVADIISSMTNGSTATRRITLVEIPPDAMRDDLERRLPVGQRFNDLTGKQIGKLRILGFAGFLGPIGSWLCQCECGTVLIVRQNSLSHNHSNSCGCIRRTHGLARTDLYNIHKQIIQRCENVRHTNFSRYGGRGIRICSGWKHNIESFAMDMGPRPSGKHSIDRVDNDGHYSCGHCTECLANGWPMNCRWATPQQQSHNSHTPRWITHNGERLCLGEWGLRLGITRERMRQRINACLRFGVDLSEAITTPPGQTMPSFKSHKAWHTGDGITPPKRSPIVIKDEWFDGKVHTVQRGVDWPQTTSGEAFRMIVQTEAAARGGKCKFRLLHDHAMFVFEKTNTAAA